VQVKSKSLIYDIVDELSTRISTLIVPSSKFISAADINAATGILRERNCTSERTHHRTNNLEIG
jgi:hypothetical protein